MVTPSDKGFSTVMFRCKFSKWLLIILMCVSSVLLAEMSGFETQKQDVIKSESNHSNWIFSGVVTNDTGEEYGYLFQLQRDGQQFYAVAAIVDAQTKKVLLFEEEAAELKHPKPLNWHVGRAFLIFNPITESWVFGLSPKNNQGFNFKVDMLTTNLKSPKAEKLRSGMDLTVSQTGRINGHLNVGQNKKEQFVHANNTWFRQVWLTEQQKESHLFSSLLCRFNDESGFYSINMKEEDAYQGAVTGLCDAKGNSSALSQFIDISESDSKSWNVRVPSPLMYLELSDSINNTSITAGFVSQGAKDGFCVFFKNKLGRVSEREAIA